MTVYPDLTQLCSPVKVVTDLKRPYGIAINSLGNMVVTEWGGGQVSVLDVSGQHLDQVVTDQSR